MTKPIKQRFLKTIKHRGGIIRQGKRSYQAEVNSGDKRIRQSFNTLGEAKGWIETKKVEVRNDGLATAFMSKEDRADAAAALKILNGCCSLETAAKEYTDALAHLDGKASLKTAVKFFNTHNRGIRPILLSDAIKEHIDRGSTWWNGDTRRERKSILNRFLTFNGDTQITNVSKADIKTYIEYRGDKAVKTRKGDISNLHAFFNDAVDHDLIKTNPAAGVSIRERSRKAEVGILTPAQMKKLLRTAINEGHEEIAACFVLIAFVGVRAKEAHRLDWDEISFTDKYVYVSEQKAKNPQARHIEMTDAAFAWLSKLAKPSGPVCTSAMHKRYWSQIRDKSGIKPWPSNALRHSYGSYFLAQTKDASQTSYNMGNTVNVINSNYRMPVPADKVSAYWAIRPAVIEEIIQMPKAKATAQASQACI